MPSGVYKRKISKITKKCLICNKKIKISLYWIKKGRGKYCSSKCFGISLTGKPLTEEHKKNISKKLKGKFIGENHPLFGKHHSKKMKKKMSKIMKGRFDGKNHPQWKGGKHLKRGYVLIYNPNYLHKIKNRNYVYEHRLIVENYLKRFLLPTEITHHINKIRSDNKIKNLMAFVNRSAHKRFHKNPNNVKPSEIIFDGRKL